MIPPRWALFAEMKAVQARIDEALRRPDESRGGV
jgi:hypothetical protein